MSCCSGPTLAEVTAEAKKCGRWEAYWQVTDPFCNKYVKYFDRTESCAPEPTCQEVCIPKSCSDDSDGTGAHSTSDDCNDAADCIKYCCSFVGRSPKGGTYCRLHGCFSLDTPITLADGSTRTFETLTDKDLLLNPVTAKPMGIREIRMSREPYYPTYEIGFGSQSVHVSQNHPFPVLMTGGQEVIKAARELTMADRILGADGRYHPLNILERRRPESEMFVYNVVLDTDSTDPRDHMILADGIITGDLWLQQSKENRHGPVPAVIAFPLPQKSD